MFVCLGVGAVWVWVYLFVEVFLFFSVVARCCACGIKGRYGVAACVGICVAACVAICVGSCRRQV